MEELGLIGHVIAGLIAFSFFAFLAIVVIFGESTE
jgi:hypothetical protein